ncbi:MAG: DUF2809 domain-containing protein [Ruminococcus sp.]|nr:DUF2809 domain-containing protein [Ruminococcus sp.]
MRKMRSLYAGIFLALLLLEILIGTFLKTGIIRAYVGDVLVLPVLYFLVRIFWTKPSRGNCIILPAVLFGVGAAAEFLQALDITGKLGIARDSLPGILLGTVCDPMDLVCYGIGTLLIYIYVHIETKLRKEKSI